MGFALPSNRVRLLLAGSLLLAAAACSGGAIGERGPAEVHGRAHPAPYAAPAIGPADPLPDLPTFAPTPLTAGLRACLPARLHPISRQFLDLWLSSRIGTRTFRRFFHMPNSDYLPVGECLLRERERMAARPRGAAPA